MPTTPQFRPTIVRSSTGPGARVAVLNITRRSRLTASTAKVSHSMPRLRRAATQGTNHNTNCGENSGEDQKNRRYRGHGDGEGSFAIPLGPPHARRNEDARHYEEQASFIKRGNSDSDRSRFEPWLGGGNQVQRRSPKAPDLPPFRSSESNHLNEAPSSVHSDPDGCAERHRCSGVHECSVGA